MTELITFILAGAVVLVGALGVVLLRRPVHAAMCLVGTLFGVAVMFVAQDAQFLAAVQVIVYAGAIVVLFLFVIMLLGVDQAEDLSVEPLTGQRPAAVVAGIAILGLSLVSLFVAGGATGAASALQQPNDTEPNITQLGRLLFTDYVFAFECTAILLTIAVIGAVMLARKPPLQAEMVDTDETAADAAAPADDDLAAAEVRS